MSLLLKSARLLRRASPLKPVASYSSHATPKEVSTIGDREVVGFGFNGQPIYMDRPDFPFPAIRYKTATADIKALREKEKGDWKKLSIEEKKQLYRASFCQTFAELNAPTGEWKSILGCTLGFIGVALWMFLGMKLFVYPKELPPTLSLERQQAQLQRMIDISVDPVEGLASEYDYEKGDWKK